MALLGCGATRLLCSGGNVLRRSYAPFCGVGRQQAVSPTYPARPLPALPALTLLQVSLGLMLATLLAWRQQLREAQEVAAHKARLSEEAAVEARAELLRSPYVRFCEPALEVAGIYGTWAVPLGLAALAAFIAALLVRPGAVGV